MGRKKSNRPVRTRQLPTIPRIFDCPRCEATAIRISMQADVALVECGNCLLRQTVTGLKSIEEPVDIFGHFVDDYYDNIDLHELPQDEATEIVTTSESEGQMSSDISQEESSSEETVLEAEQHLEEAAEEEEEEEHEEPPQIGFVPRTKGDVLKKKNKEKDSKKSKKLTL